MTVISPKKGPYFSGCLPSPWQGCPFPVSAHPPSALSSHPGPSPRNDSLATIYRHVLSSQRRLGIPVKPQCCWQDRLTPSCTLASWLPEGFNQLRLWGELDGWRRELPHTSRGLATPGRSKSISRSDAMSPHLLHSGKGPPRHRTGLPLGAFSFSLSWSKPQRSLMLGSNGS